MIDTTSEPLAYHYTTAHAFEKIKSSGLLKSRALLISEELRSRPDWEQIKHDRNAIVAALPRHATSIFSELTYKPCVWFTDNEFWEPQAGYLGMGADRLKLGSAESRQRKPLNMDEMYSQGGGLIRLAMPQSKLVHQSRLDEVLGVPLILRIIAIARIGSDPRHRRSSTFFGYVAPSLPLSEIARIESFVPETGWTPQDTC